MKRRSCITWIALQAMMAAVVWTSPARAANEGERRVGCMAFPLVRQLAEGNVVVPAMVVLRNPHPEFSGVIEAWIGDRKETHVCRRPVTVGKGEFRFFLYPQAGEQGGGDSLCVKLVDSDGQSEGVLEGALRRVQADWYVLAVVGRDRFFGTQELSELKTLVNQVRQTDLLPDQWYGYGMFDAVFWDGQVTTSLEPVQKKALTDWIRRGGTLILGAKAGDLAARSPIPDLVPDLHLTESAGDSGRTVIKAAEIPAESARPFAVLPLGLGRVVFPQADFGDVAAWPEQHKRQLLRGQQESKELPLPGRVQLDRRIQVDNDSLAAVLYPWQEFRPMLARLAGYTALNFTPILITMLIYILVVSVLDYVVLKKAKRLPWTWVTFPAMIVLFSTYSFFSFYKGRLGNLVRHEILFQDVARDGSCRFKAWSCIRNNSNMPIRFDLEVAHLLTPAGVERQDDYYYNPGRLSVAQNARGWTQDASVRGGDRISIPAYVGSYSFLEEEWLGHETRSPCEISLRHTRAGLEGQIVDHARTATAAATFILYRNKIYEVDAQLRVGNRSAATPSISAGQASEARSYGLLNAASVAAVVARARREAQTAPALDQAQGLRQNGQAVVSRRTDLSIFNRTDREALVIMCYEEQTKRGGLPVSRVTCVRRVVEVENGENDHD